MAEDPTPSDNPEADRPEWLPTNFDRPEALVDSYKEAQRKITEEATARRNLETIVAQQQASLEAWQAQAQQQPEPEQPWGEWLEQDPVATFKVLAEQTADAKINAKFAEWQASQQQQTQDLVASHVESVAFQAKQQLEDRHGPISQETWEEMTRIANEHPHLLPPDVGTSASKLTPALDILYKVTLAESAPAQQSQAELQRTMKLQAQSATGAGGHLSPADEAQQRWQEITNASTGKLGL